MGMIPKNQAIAIFSKNTSHNNPQPLAEYVSINWKTYMPPYFQCSDIKIYFSNSNYNLKIKEVNKKLIQKG